ncbi:MAG: prepilin-type N-terminal cleavage/methylation domain-containing protein [Acidobacteriota bacterium]
MAESSSSRSCSGFSLVEVLIATGLLATSLVAVAQLFAVATKANSSARTSTFATVLAQQKMEQLRELTWGFDQQNNAVSDLQTDLAVTPPSPAGGLGLSPSPARSLLDPAAGYVDYLDAAGTWIGTGTRPVAGTTYIRRWSITPLPADPANTLVLQVLVTRIRDRGTANNGAGTRLPNEARIMSIKTRKFQ